jgi:hypothetical protein
MRMEPAHGAITNDATHTTHTHTHHEGQSLIFTNCASMFQDVHQIIERHNIVDTKRCNVILLKCFKKKSKGGNKVAPMNSRV